MCSVVNRGSSGVLLSREPGLYRGNVGTVRTQFIFYEMCPGASRYTGCPASGWTVATPAQWEWGLRKKMGSRHFVHITQYFHFSLTSILDAILDISKSSMMRECPHSDFSRTLYALPESTKKFKIKVQVLLKFAKFCLTIQFYANSFETLQVMVWRCTYCQDIIVRLFLSLLPENELSHFCQRK